MSIYQRLAWMNQNFLGYTQKNRFFGRSIARNDILNRYLNFSTTKIDSLTQIIYENTYGTCQLCLFYHPEIILEKKHGKNENLRFWKFEPHVFDENVVLWSQDFFLKSFDAKRQLTLTRYPASDSEKNVFSTDEPWNAIAATRRRESRHSGHHLVPKLKNYAALRVSGLCIKVYVSTSLLMH